MQHALLSTKHSTCDFIPRIYNIFNTKQNFMSINYTLICVYVSIYIQTYNALTLTNSTKWSNHIFTKWNQISDIIDNLVSYFIWYPRAHKYSSYQWNRIVSFIASEWRIIFIWTAQIKTSDLKTDHWKHFYSGSLIHDGSAAKFDMKPQILSKGIHQPSTKQRANFNAYREQCCSCEANLRNVLHRYILHLFQFWSAALWNSN